MKITFSDGYAVSISATEIKVTMNGKPTSKADPLYLRPASELADVSKAIKAKGVNPEDYLATSSFVVRRGNGVEEAITSATAERRATRDAEKAELYAKHEATREVRRKTIASKTPEWESHLAEMVAKIPDGAVRVDMVQTGYFDGYPSFSYSADGQDLTWRDVEFVGRVDFLGDGECGFQEKAQFVAFIPRDKLESIRSENKAMADSKTAENQAEAAARKAIFDEAASTGRSVKLAGWVTDRCMNGHSRQCSFDTATEFALPDGTTKISYACCC